MPLVVTPVYAGVLALLLVYLSISVIRQRLSGKISVGDGGNKELQKAIRVQANCAEYAPMGLLMLGFGELQGMPYWLIHLLGFMLLAGRLLHAYGFGATPQVIPARRAGMILTFAMLVLSGVAMILYALI